MNKITHFIKKYLNFPHKFHTFINTIRTFKNWPLRLEERYNLFHNKDDELVIHLRNGIKFYFKFGDNELGQIEDIWDKKAHTRYSSIQDSYIVIDIGANIGVFSIFTAKAANKVKVFAYEPTPDVFRRFVKNIKINNLEGNIFPFQLGVTGETGERELFFYSGGSIGNTLTPSKDNFSIYKRDSVIIKTITLKDIFNDNNLDKCDFLKINCEGAEYEILFNTPVKYFKKIGSIVMNYHQGFEEIISFLEKIGFVVYHDRTLNFIWALRESKVG